MFHKVSLSMAMVLLLGALPPALAQENKAAAIPTEANDEQAVRQATDALTQAFNAGQAEKIGELFFNGADLIDDAGNVYKGRAAIVELFKQFFAKFPGATSTMTPGSIRFIGPGVAIEEGKRVVTTKDRAASSDTRYTLVFMKLRDAWKIASAKETDDDESETPHDRLLPLAWMVGDWVDEGSDALVTISCRWSDDKNFLISDYNVKVQGKPALKSTQRIGWDPLTKKVKSWSFDSDGGHGEGTWTQLDNRWVIKSMAVLPDGRIGSATLTITPGDKDSFVMKGTDRIQGDVARPDFEVTVVRKPPEPGK